MFKINPAQINVQASVIHSSSQCPDLEQNTGIQAASLIRQSNKKKWNWKCFYRPDIICLSCIFPYAIYGYIYKNVYNRGYPIICIGTYTTLFYTIISVFLPITNSSKSIALISIIPGILVWQLRKRIRKENIGPFTFASCLEDLWVSVCFPSCVLTQMGIQKKLFKSSFCERDKVECGQ